MSGGEACTRVIEESEIGGFIYRWMIHVQSIHQLNRTLMNRDFQKCGRFINVDPIYKSPKLL